MLRPKQRPRLYTFTAVAALLTGAWFALPHAIAADAGWEEVVKIEGTAGFGNERVEKKFDLPVGKKVKIKWDLRPTGNAPLFRATLGSYKDNLGKYVNTGVIVRAGGASTKEQSGNLPAGKHRVVFTMKRMRYSFTILAQK